MKESTPQLLSAVPQFAVRDVVRAAEYYRDVLGFGIASYWDGERRTMAPAAPPPFGIVFRDQVQVFFYRSDDPIPRDGGYHAYFHVSGVDALADECAGPGRRDSRRPRRYELWPAGGRNSRYQWPSLGLWSGAHRRSDILGGCGVAHGFAACCNRTPCG